MQKKRRWKAFALFLFFGLLAISCSTRKNESGLIFIDNPVDTIRSKQEISKIRSLKNDLFIPAGFTGKENIEIKYRLFKPVQDQNVSRKYPLVVVYHGSGLIGSDNGSQLGLLQKLFASPDIQKKYPAFVLAPQFPTRSSDYVLDSSRNVLSSVSRPCLRSVFELIDSLKQNLNINANRIYVIGFSMGGSTVINSLSERPDLFAAGISISGIPQFDKIQNVTSIPIWLIHGIDDTENPINSDEQFYKELKNNNKILFWKVKAATHDNVFTTQLLGETLPKWLFKMQKK